MCPSVYRVLRECKYWDTDLDSFIYLSIHQYHNHHHHQHLLPFYSLGCLYPRPCPLVVPANVRFTSPAAHNSCIHTHERVVDEEDVRMLLMITIVLS